MPTGALWSAVHVRQLNILEIPSLDEQVRSFVAICTPSAWISGTVCSRPLTILNHIDDHDIDNVVILTGDIHTSWPMKFVIGLFLATFSANPASL